MAREYSLPNKLKICIGFYMIAGKVSAPNLLTSPPFFSLRAAHGRPPPPPPRLLRDVAQLVLPPVQLTNQRRLIRARLAERRAQRRDERLTPHARRRATAPASRVAHVTRALLLRRCLRRLPLPLYRVL